MSINYQNVNLVMSAGFPEQFPQDNLPQIAFPDALTSEKAR